MHKLHVSAWIIFNWHNHNLQKSFSLGYAETISHWHIHNSPEPFTISIIRGPITKNFVEFCKNNELGALAPLKFMGVCENHLISVPMPIKCFEAPSNGTGPTLALNGLVTKGSIKFFEEKGFEAPASQNSLANTHEKTENICLILILMPIKMFRGTV